mgnify:CR=1 FL=1
MTLVSWSPLRTRDKSLPLTNTDIHIMSWVPVLLDSLNIFSLAFQALASQLLPLDPFRRALAAPLVPRFPMVTRGLRRVSLHSRERVGRRRSDKIMEGFLPYLESSVACKARTVVGDIVDICRLQKRKKICCRRRSARRRRLEQWP